MSKLRVSPSRPEAREVAATGYLARWEMILSRMASLSAFVAPSDEFQEVFGTECPEPRGAGPRGEM